MVTTDISVLATRRKQFKVLYRWCQMVSKGGFFIKGKYSLEDIIGRYGSRPQYMELVELEGQETADYLLWWTCWIVFLYLKFGPGQVEAAWEYFLGFIKEKEGEVN